jgi:hypothetical protein
MSEEKILEEIRDEVRGLREDVEGVEERHKQGH